ncbi:MAG: NAD-dependent epimerase [Candidatus Cloacimonetes bacterium]|nr:NAD-dependent epimerase [Candidatus Cloacimonadota bacterium]
MTCFLVTGAAGFIGYHTSKKLLERGDRVIGLDVVNDYYDVELKYNRLRDLQTHENFIFEKVDLCDYETLCEVFKRHDIDKICNLAAQAGVRYSIENPFAYQKSNLEGFLNILECARHFKVQNLVYASSSSVYGKNTNYPFTEDQNVDNPISLYAATKKANELMAHTYHHLYGIPTTGLRFFTVYGPFGRPDMALFLFTKAILEGKPIDIYNHGKMQRDFTYVDDIVSGVIGSLDNNNPYEIFNLGNNKTVELTYFIECIEKSLGMTAEKNFMPLQPGDVPKTSANIDKAKSMIGFDPKTAIEEGIEHFVKWYREYYN